jgi:leader peptidase (prepilin peptidase) / N-methyltransferase
MTIPHWYLVTCAGVLGLVLGSAVTALAHRVPRGLSWVHGRSRCPGCGHELAARDLVPVFSWLLARGRCRHCAAPVSARYPLTELACGAWAALAADHLGPVWTLPFVMVWGALLVGLFWIDVDEHLLPDALTFPGLVVGLIAALPYGPRIWVYGALVGTIPLFLLLLIWEKVLKVDGMGFGDIKLGLMFGVLLGPLLTMLAIFLGALAGTIVGGVLMLRGRGHLRSELPFGAFLAPAALVSWLWGAPLVEAYLGLLFRR